MKTVVNIMKTCLGCVLGTFFLLSAGPVRAQSARELIAADADRAANVYHHYETFGTYDTPAPAGYKPFYISHYGRHGSRYHASESFFTGASSYLEKLDSAGLLTDAGAEMLADIRLYMKDQDGLYGTLTQRGVAEHQGIASRMYKRFPAVFSQKGAKEILCVSSVFHRCLQSMAAFTGELRSLSPDLRIALHTGQRYMDYISYDVPANPYQSAVLKHVKDSMRNSLVDGSRIAALVCKMPSAAFDVTGREASEFVMDLYFAGCIHGVLDYEMPDIFRKYFTLDELCGCQKVDDCNMYGRFGYTDELMGWRSEGMGRPLLRDFLEKADEVLAGERPGKVADLRFGHDGGIGSMLFLLRVENNEGETTIARGADRWQCFREMCMASNLQMVFYRNRKGDVLVKLLHNERETTILGLAPVEGPYYSWSDLREYFIRRLGESEAQ